MRIAEIFHSIQGEGELAGVPSVFVRTSGCNLRCRWCDTPYASWSPVGRQMQPDEIVDEVAKFSCNHVVITGGEPMIANDIHSLLCGLKERGLHLTIETAATIPPGGVPCDLASLSPKLAHSVPAPDEFGQAWSERHNATRLQPKVIADWLDSYPYQLKFVLESPSDLDEMERLLATVAREVPPHKILLMPQGTTPKALRQNQHALVDLCKSKGYRFSPRLHIDLFGNTPGT